MSYKDGSDSAFLLASLSTGRFENRNSIYWYFHDDGSREGLYLNIKL